MMKWNDDYGNIWIWDPEKDPTSVILIPNKPVEYITVNFIEVKPDVTFDEVVKDLNGE